MDIFSEVLHLSFNASVNERTFPSVFKFADVTPIFKKGSKNLNDNYRPIRILKNLSKVLENIMYKQMATFMDKYFSNFQCGFRKSYSTQQCLIALIEKRKSAVDSGKSFGALLTDLPKAFNCLPHKPHLAKLGAYVFRLSALRLFCSYLFSRQERTKINASYSCW